MSNSLLDYVSKRSTRVYDQFRIRLQNNSLPPITDAEQQLADAFKAKLQALPIPESSEMSPAQKAWNENMRDLQKFSIADDPRNFLSWDVVGGTMFVKYAKYSREEYRYLKKLQKWNRWEAALIENTTGNPVRCPFDTRTSCNLVHHAYHLAQFEGFLNQPAESFHNVFEFGGGYGSMCRLFFNLGFRGRYLIVDLPAFSILQEYYLSSIGVRVLSIEEYIDGEPGVLCISDMDIIHTLLDNNSNSLFLATWSISEAPLSVRKGIFDNHAGSFDAYLIAYQPRFEDVDNSRFFEDLRKTRTEYVWEVRDIAPLPGQKYLFGKKSTSGQR